MKTSFSSNLKTKLGLGTWQFGGANVINGKPMGWGDFDKTEAISIVKQALNSGVTFFDTSDSYGNGLSESILGEALKESGSKREDVIICTKFGHSPKEGNLFAQDFSVDWLEKSVAASLKRLQVKYLDVLLLHSPPDNFDWKNYDTQPFEVLIKKGLIKQYGVSSKSIYGAKRAMENGFGSVIETIYNLLDRRAEDVLFKMPAISEYDIIARVPLASGFLTSKYLNKKPVFDNDNYRSNLPDRDANWLFENSKKLDFLVDNEGGISGNALKFCLQNEHVSVVIPGARNLAQLNENITALSFNKLSSEAISQIKDAVPDVAEWWKPRPV